MLTNRLLRIILTSILLHHLLVASPAAADDWPQWGGPQRDLVWREEGIVGQLPAGQLPRMWSTPIGEGYAGPAVANGRVYVMDFIREVANNGTERVLCLDAQTGEILFKHEYDTTYTISYPHGPRATPTVDGDRVYAVGAMGHLWCLDANSGSVIWQHNYVDEFDTELPNWGIAGAPLVDEENVYCLVGGKPNALVVCFDKLSGEEKWRALEDGDVGYSPPVIFEFGGRRQLVQWHPKALSSLDPATGEVLWEVPFAVSQQLAIATPRKSGNRILVTSFYNSSMMARVSENGTSASMDWKGKSNSERDTDTLHSIIPTPVFDGDYIYGVCSYGQMRCLDATDGRRIWETRKPTGDGRWWNAFIIPHQDRYFIANEQGELIIADLSPDGYRELSRAKLIEPTRQIQRRMVVWSHPAFAMQSVFARNDKQIVRVDLADKSQ